MTNHYRTPVKVKDLEVYQYTVLGCLYQLWNTVERYSEDCFVLDGATIDQGFKYPIDSLRPTFDPKDSRPCTLDEFLQALPLRYTCFNRYSAILGACTADGERLNISPDTLTDSSTAQEHLRHRLANVTFIDGTVISSSEVHLYFHRRAGSQKKYELVEMTHETDRIVITRANIWHPYYDDNQNIILPKNSPES